MPLSELPSFANVRRNMVHFPSLPVPLRALTGMAIAQVLATVLMLAFKDAHWPAIQVGLWQDKPLMMAWPFLLLSTLLLIGGWTYLLAGALQARWWIGLPVIALAALAFLPWLEVGIGPLGVAALLALLAYVLARTVGRRRFPLAVDLGVLAGLIGVLVLAPFVLALRRDDPNELLGFSVAITGQMLPLLVFLIPMLVLAGVDLAELSGEVGAWLTEHALQLIPLRPAVVAILLLAVAKVAIQVAMGSHVLPLLRVALPTAIGLASLLAALVYLLRRRHEELEPPGFGLFLALSYALFAVFIAAFVVPASTSTQGLAMAAQQGAVQGEWALAGLAAIVVGLTWAGRRWRHQQALSPTGLFLVLYGLWVCLSVGNPLALLGHWGADRALSPAVTLPSLDVAVCLVAIGALLVLARLHRLDRVSLGLVGAMLVGLSLVEFADALYTNNVAATADLVTLAQIALLLAALAVGLGRTALRSSAALGGRLALLGFLLVTAAMVADLAVIVNAVAQNMHTVTQRLPSAIKLPQGLLPALVLALGLGWDMLMSGGRFTNQHSERFPRHGRLLLYLGYISLAAAALLWTDALGDAASFFDPNILPPYGIAVLGLPLLFYLWALKAHVVWHAAAPGGGPKPE